MTDSLNSPDWPESEHLQDEQRACWQRGERVRAETLLARYPGLEADADLVLELIYAEVLLREAQGEVPRLEEYLLRFPQFTTQLRDQFEVHHALEQGGPCSMEPMPNSGTLPVDSRSNGPPSTVQVPGYVILKELGRGGMGIVYQAWHERLHRLVALKVLRGGALAGADERARFRIEAEAVARLEHPNIVHIHEVGEQAGQPYFVLEYVEGGSLAQALAGGLLVMPPKQAHQKAAELVKALAGAMDYAHRRGVVHRDLTPGNVLLAADGIPKITDFGLAKLVLEGSEGWTETGAFLGTPSYVAPEQAEGRTRAISPATDVYALGAILYEMLTGRPPFKADNPLETLRRVVADDPVRPARLRPQLPRDLETICLKCLQKQPSRRYESAAALADDLHRFLAGEPVRARPLRGPERTIRWVKRRPAVAALLGVITLAALSLLTAGVLFTRQLQRERDTADKGSQKAREQARLAELAGADALRQKTLAKQEAQRALTEKRNAQRENANYRHTLYAAHIHLAYQAWLDGRTARVLELLDGDGCPPDLRGWEWRYLRGLCHKDQWSIKAHDDRVTSLAWSPNHRLLASASYDGTVRLWNLVETGAPHILRGHTGWVWQVAFNSSGRLLASASDDGTVRIWEPSGGRLVRTLSPGMDRVRCVAFSPDDRFLAAGGRDGTVKIWETVGWRVAHVLREHTDLVASVAFSPDGRLLASTGQDRVVRLWDTHRGTVVGTFRGHTKQVSSVAFSPDSKMLATASEDTTVRLWEVSTGALVRTFRGHTAWVVKVAFSPDGRFLASASYDNTVRLWDVRSAQLVRVYRGHQSEACEVVFSPDGRWLASADIGGTIKFWDSVGSDQEGRSLRAEPETVSRVAFSPDGLLMASANRSLGPEGTVWLWDAARGVPRQVLRGHRAEVWGLAFSPDGQWLATGSNDKTVKVWETASGRLLRTLEGYAHSVRDVAFSPDGRLLASGCVDGTISLWDLTTWRRTCQLTGHTEAVVSVVFHRDGRRLASGSHDGTVNLWDIPRGRLLLTLRASVRQIHSVAFSPDGRWLATGDEDATVKLWDLNSANPIRILRGHAGGVIAVTFSPDSRRLASVGADMILRLWSVDSGQELLSIHKHTDMLWTAAFSPNGRQLATAGGDRTIQLWETPADQEKQRPVLVPSGALSLTWHRQQVETCQKEEQWFALVWHLDRLIPLEVAEQLGWLLRVGGVGHLAKPPAFFQALYWWRANAQSELGQWDKADQDYAAAVALGPGHVGPWNARALARLRAGDLPSYRHVCEEMSRHFTIEPHSPGMRSVAWTCLLGPTAVKDFRQLLRALELAVAKKPSSCRFRHELGGILYRSGQDQTAVHQLQEAMKCHAGGQGTIQDWLFLAMAHHRLGHPATARQWLDKATRSLNAQKADPAPEQTLSWPQRTALRILHHEARALIMPSRAGNDP